MAEISFRRTRYIGRPMDFEANDCSVRSMMSVTRRPYIEAHNLMSSIGREFQKGVDIKALEKLLDKKQVLGCEFERVKGIHEGRKKTLRVFLREHRTGSFYCLVAGHAFAVIDGALVDTQSFSDLCRIYAAWEVKGFEPVATQTRSEHRISMEGYRCRSKTKARRIAVLRELTLKAGDGLSRTIGELNRLLDDHKNTLNDVRWLAENHLSVVEVELDASPRRFVVAHY